MSIDSSVNQIGNNSWHETRVITAWAAGSKSEDPNPRTDWLKAKGLHIINTRTGKRVNLKGINLSNNVWGNWVHGVSQRLKAQGKFPLVRPKRQDNWVLTDSDFRRLKKLGVKVVRYGINYELFARNNPHRSANLAKLKRHIKKFAQNGTYVIVSLQRPQGLDDANGRLERYKPPSIRLQSIFENDTYWKNTIAMWQYLAKNLKGMPAVAGYYLFSEPTLPSNADGGMPRFQKKYNQLCAAIRAIDRKHILFVAERMSRERNDKFQSHVWDRGWVKVKATNVVYSFSFYEPGSFTYAWKFTHSGPKGYSRSWMDSYIRKRVNWARTKGRAPLFVAEYGANRNNSAFRRYGYIRVVHELFKKYGLPAAFWEYKSRVGAWEKPFNILGLYGEYVDRATEVIRRSNGTYQFRPSLYSDALRNNFIPLFHRYFQNNNVSLMDNQRIWNELNRFYSQQ